MPDGEPRPAPESDVELETVWAGCQASHERLVGTVSDFDDAAVRGPSRLEGWTVGVQLYAPTNPPLTDYLAGVGAMMAAVLPYVYAPATDAERVVDLIKAMQAGKVDVIVFTSSPQVDRLYEVAGERELTTALTEGFGKTRVAAVGPVVADSLRRHGAPVHVCPEQGFVMKNLVKQICGAESPSEPEA